MVWERMKDENEKKEKEWKKKGSETKE